MEIELIGQIGSGRILMLAIGFVVGVLIGVFIPLGAVPVVGPYLTRPKDSTKK